MSNRCRLKQAVCALIAVVTAGACGQGTPSTPEERKARGLELLNASGKVIASAQTLSFTAREQGERVRRSGQKESVTIERVVRVRRPDRLHIKSSGDRDLEIFYNGERATLLSAGQKVYGVIPVKGTLNEVVAEFDERYDIPFPLGDLVTFTSAEDVVGRQATGGWSAEETIDGRVTDKIAWQHPNVDWTVWIARDAQPLPVRLELLYKARRGTPARRYDFSNWQLGGDQPDSVFAVTVPADYEGIPVIQRASAVQDAIEKAKTEPGGAADKEKR